MLADVFHRHGSLALLINAGAACGYSFADWKPVEKGDRLRRCKITGLLEAARVVDYAERITNGRESRFLSPRVHLATDRGLVNAQAGQSGLNLQLPGASETIISR